MPRKTAPPRESFRNSRLTYSQVVEVLERRDEGELCKHLAAEFKITTQTIRAWAAYSGLSAEWIKRVKQLEVGLATNKQRTKRAQSNLLIASNLLRRYEPSAARRSIIATAICERYQLDRAAGNRIVGLDIRSGAHSRKTRLGNALLVREIRRRLRSNPTSSFTTVLKILLKNRPGLRSSAVALLAKKVRKERSQTKRTALAGTGRPMLQQGSSDQVWSMDFMHDALKNGRRFFILNVIDDFSREILVSKVSPLHTAKVVIDSLSALASKGRSPDRIRMDNAMEFKSVGIRDFFKKHNVEPIYIRARRPVENAFVESFNGTMRSELLSRFEFESLTKAQCGIDDWCMHFNYARPHSSLGDLSPLMYLESNAR